MTFGPFETLPRFRAYGDSRFVASCPTAAHNRGDRHQSFSGKVAGRKILINCKVGCSAKQILDAMGLGWDALFLDRWAPPTAANLRKQATLQGFRQWRDQATNEAGAELRGRDMVAIAASTALELGNINEEQFWEILSDAYHRYGELEHKFEILRTGTDAQALEVYRNA